MNENVLHFKKLKGKEGRRYLARMRLLSPRKTYHVKYEGVNALDIAQILHRQDGEYCDKREGAGR